MKCVHMTVGAFVICDVSLSLYVAHGSCGMCICDGSVCGI